LGRFSHEQVDLLPASVLLEIIDFNGEWLAWEAIVLAANGPICDLQRDILTNR